MHRVIMSLELVRSPSMSKMQARIAGKLMLATVSFGMHGTTFTWTTYNARTNCHAWKSLLKRHLLCLKGNHDY
jgi:hypothetical protein